MSVNSGKWEAVPVEASGKKWWIVVSDDVNVIADGLTEDNAKFIAKAPEMRAKIAELVEDAPLQLTREWLDDARALLSRIKERQ